MADDKKHSEWVSGEHRRYVLDPDDVAELERDSGIHEFVHGKPREEAESQAYSDYRKKHHSIAAAYHLARTRAAHSTGEYKEAKRHRLLYDLHLKALGYDPDEGKVPDTVQHIVEDPARESGIKFKGHKADSFLMEKSEKPIDPDQLEEGSKEEEKEHGLGRKMSTKIAADHLKEDPNAYKKEELNPKVPVGAKVDKEPINYNDVEQLRSVFGEAVPKDFHPANAQHWSQFINALEPRQREFVMRTLFAHDQWRSKRGLGPATGPGLGVMPLREEDQPSAMEKLGTDKVNKGEGIGSEVGGTIPSNQGDLLMSEPIHRAFDMAPDEARKSVLNEQMVKHATLATLEVLLKKNLAALNPNVPAPAVQNPSAMPGRAGVKIQEQQGGKPAAEPAKPKFTLDHLKQAYKQAGIKPPIGSVTRKDELSAQPHHAIKVRFGDIKPGMFIKMPQVIGGYSVHKVVGTKPSEHAGYGYVIYGDGRWGTHQLLDTPWEVVEPGAGPTIGEAETTAKAEEKINPNEIKVRDEGIRRSKLPPGAPGSDKAGAGVQEDKKKEASRKAARGKWKPEDE